jgi:hypothetical protein
MRQARKLNKLFFKEINSEIKAYLLGFYLADGSLHNNRLQIGVSEKDYYIVQLYKNFISPYTKIIYYKPNNKGEKPCYKFQIMDKELIKPLIDLGWGYRKTYLTKKLPKLKDELLFHLIRGYFDGDGNVLVNLRERKSGRQKGYKTILRSFSIWSKNDSHLYDIQDLFKKYNIKSSIKNYTKGFVIIISDLYSLELLYEKFYNNATYYMGRKKLKFKLTTKTSSKLRVLKIS